MYIGRPLASRAAAALLFLASAHIAVGAESGTATDPSHLRIGPAPMWVEPVTWAPPTDTPPPGESAEIILSDGQDQVTTHGSDFYFHRVVRLYTAEAVSSEAQLTNEIVPDFETVTWHTLKIYRDGKVLDRLPQTEFKPLQREPGLEAQMLTGQTTYAAVVDDVRVGDVIETAYTTHYHNPLFDGAISVRHDLGAGYPIRHERVIIHLPADGPTIRSSFIIPEGIAGLPDPLYRLPELESALTDESAGGGHVIRWEASNLPAIEFDAGTASRAYPYLPRLRVSSFTTWGDVEAWAEPLFATTSKVPDPLPTLLATWQRDPDPVHRIAAAVHWVQDDVRYFGLELGQHNMRPRALADVCSTRYGDCKDKALLLVTLLRALGIEAWPALTNTYWRDRLHHIRPDPYAFNHAVVAYRLHDQLHWIDATLNEQQGPPGEWAFPHHRTALIIRHGEDDLTDIPSPQAVDPDVQTLDRITINPQSGDATVDTTVTIRRLQADYYRQWLKTMSAHERSNAWFNFIAQFYRNMEEVDPPVVKDDTATNILTLTARYRLPNFVHDEDGQKIFSTYAYAIRSLLNLPESRRRHWPYALPSDRFIRHRIEIDLPFDTPLGQQPEVIRTPGFEYRAEVGLAGRRLVAQDDLRVTADFVPADRMARFCDDVSAILKTLALTVHVPDSAASAVTSPAK